MNILIITQVFWPDTASTAQHLADLATNLSKRGHNVKVFTGKTAYEHNEITYPKRENYLGVSILRLNSTGFGKANIIGRLLDSLSFNFILFFKMLFLKKREFDVVIGMTSPPLISFIGAFIAGIKKCKFCYWTMDLQPELAIIAKYIKEGSLMAKSLIFLGDYIFKKADLIITLDKYMVKHVIERGAKIERVSMIPVWPVMEDVYEGKRDENPFRIENQFGDRIVIMYSGNHAMLHPLDTVLETSLALKDHEEFLFVFIGEGIRKKDVTLFKNKHGLKNIIQLPYQPRKNIHLSLGAADIHVVILGDKRIIGVAHPNKIYGAMFIGKPLIYIGPKESFIGDIIDKCKGNIAVEIGESEALTRQLLEYSTNGFDFLNEAGGINRSYAQEHFHPRVLIDNMINEIEKLEF